MLRLAPRWRPPDVKLPVTPGNHKRRAPSRIDTCNLLEDIGDDLLDSLKQIV
jgi:hypothetical protein